jgi:NADP-reducing hydrogenase subunit HndD
MSVRNFTDLRSERARALYGADAAMKLRKSHESPIVKELYASFLGKPGSHIAHELLHTTYIARSKYPGFDAERQGNRQPAKSERR